MAHKSRSDVLHQIESSGIVAVIRADSAEQLVDVCMALRDGGVIACEITMTTPNAIDAIARANDAIGGDCLIGVGSVLDAETARAAILAGAQFVFSPTFNPQVIEMAHRYDKVAVPGAMTPTEIINAWSAGADIVKIFPANHFGPKYIKDLHGPMPQLKVTPTGGVDLTTATDWIHAGAACLGVGSALVKKDFIRDQNWAGLTDLAKQYVEVVKGARATKKR